MSTLIAESSRTTAAEPGSARSRRRWLKVDALMSGSSGLALLIGAPLLDEPFGVATWLLMALGLFFLAYAGALVALARRGARRRDVIGVAFANLAWVALTVMIVAADTLTLTTAGTIVATAQAVAVALVAELQWLSARGRPKEQS